MNLGCAFEFLPRADSQDGDYWVRGHDDFLGFWCISPSKGAFRKTYHSHWLWVYDTACSPHLHVVIEKEQFIVHLCDVFVLLAILNIFIYWPLIHLPLWFVWLYSLLGAAFNITREARTVKTAHLIFIVSLSTNYCCLLNSLQPFLQFWLNLE